VYVRVVRFSGASADQVEGVVSRIKEQGGPPPGAPIQRLTVLFDAEQGTAVVLQQFETAEGLEAGAAVLSAMDASETPGTRVSVDTCEVMLDVTPA
jgi:hypothetical protein